jgi:hypothetical protein
MPYRRVLMAGALSALAIDAAASCGAAFCAVNTEWATQGGGAEPGLRLDLRYEYVDQDQPRHGTDRIAVGAIPAHHDEVETLNRNWIGTLDWGISPAWSLSFALPYVDRDHLHIHNHRGEKLEERWNLRGIGDARAVASYQAAAWGAAESPNAAGLSFGVKLPTGEYDQANGAGAVAERSLQPGTGTTDAIVGAWWHGAAPLAGWSWFARAQAQFAARLARRVQARQPGAARWRRPARGGRLVGVHAAGQHALEGARLGRECRARRQRPERDLPEPGPRVEPLA